MEKKTIYIPVKVEDELPEFGKNVFTFNTMTEGRVSHPPMDDGENISINRRTSEIFDGLDKWYDENNFGFLYSKVNSWLKKQESFVFTPEELNELLSNVIKQTLETAAENVSLNIPTNAWQNRWVEKQSITDTFDETFNKFKV